MASEVTRIADVIVPEVFNPYVDEYVVEHSMLRQSGIVGTVPGLAVPNGGAMVNMPFWPDLGGEDQVLSDTVPLDTKKIMAGNDIAVILKRGDAWKANDLATSFAGSDVMGAIGRKVGDYWIKVEQAILIAILKGVFGSASMSDSILDITNGGTEVGAGAVVSKNNLVDAISLLGDAGKNLTGLVTHSAVMYDMAKKSVLDARVNVGDTNTAPEFQSYLGRTVIADDGCPVETITVGGKDYKVYTTYIFGQGAIGSAIGAPPVPTETQRDALGGNDILVNRRHMILHPRGVKYTNAVVVPSDATPSNVTLANAANWERVYEQKNVRMIAFKHLIG